MGLQRRPAIMFASTLVCLAGLCAAHAAQAQHPPIEVDGSRHVDPDIIRSYLHPNADGSFHAEDLDAALKALYGTQLFNDVQISRSGPGIRVKVTDNPIIARIAFEGTKSLKDKQLKPLVQSKEGGPLSRALVHDDVERILAIYRRNGRFNARVEPKTIDNKNRGVSLVFEIKEGERTGIVEIQFVGNSAFVANKLKGAIKTGQTNFLSFLVDNDFYDPDKVEIDRDLLSRFYRAHGYPDIHVVSAAPRYDAAKKGLVLTFTLDEGPRYRFGTVIIKSGVNAVGSNTLKPLLKMREGDVYNADAVDKTTDIILMDLARHGEPFAAVKTGSEHVPGQHVINVFYDVEPGPRVYVERVEIHGNTKTQDNVIRRELTFAEGSPYNRALVQTSEQHLKKLGFFKTVKFSEKNGSAPDRVVLDLKVEEQDTGQFSIAGGYSDTAGAVGNVTIGDRNFFGRGESVKLSLDYGQYTKGFDLAYSEPYLFGQRVTLGLDAFAKQNDSNSNQSYTSTIYGGKISVGTPLTDQLGLQWRYSLTNQSLVLDPSLGTASIPVQEAAAAGPMWVSAVGSTISYNTLDDDQHPTSGLRADVNNDVAGLGGDVKFLRNTDDLRYYQPIANDITSITRAQTGYIIPWGGQSLPLLNGFFGGPQLVRGFAPNGFGPRDITPGTTMDNLGGNAYWATSEELQAPIPMLPPEFQLKAAVFADAGSLWRTGASSYGPALSQSLQVSNSRAIRSSIGTGLVWDSILGPIRVDYAYPLTKGPYDVTQRLHFGYGMF